MARTPSTKTLALRTLNDANAGSATRWAALEALKPHISVDEYALRLRQLAASARAKVLRLCLLRLAELEKEERAKAAKVEAEKQSEQEAALDARIRELLTSPKPGGSKTIPEPATTKPEQVPSAVASVPVNEVSPAQPASSENGKQAPFTKPVLAIARPAPRRHFPVEDGAGTFDDLRRFERMAEQSERETLDAMAQAAGFPHYSAMQSATLAAERDRRMRPKRRFAGMPTCGDALNGET